jgi:endonuclease III
MTLNLIITADDIECSRKLQNQERIDMSTSDNMFLGLVYVMLSAKEKYTTQMIMYERLIKSGMTTPESILANKDNLSTIVKGLRKDEYLYKLAEWWSKSGTFETIMNDLNNNGPKNST